MYFYLSPICSRICVYFSSAASAYHFYTQIYTCVRKKHSAFLVLVWIFVSDCSGGCENPAYRSGYENKYREIHSRNRLCHRIFALIQSYSCAQLHLLRMQRELSERGSLSSSTRRGPRERERASNGFWDGRYFREKPRLAIRLKVPNYPRNTIPGKFLRRNSELGVTRFARHRFRTTSKVSILKGRSPILSSPLCLRSIRNSTVEMTELLSRERKRNARIGGTNGSRVVQLRVVYFCFCFLTVLN